jgi:MFS family permease
MMKNTTEMRKLAWSFLWMIGIISLFSDFVHEGARSIYGPYLDLLGASAFLVATVSGLGEFIGQALRVLTGWIADKTRKYWLMMILGYAINLLVIPLLYFVDVSVWELALVLILLERVGKGIRAPAKSALTSFVSPHLGAGKSFAIQEALDQLGAFLGPIFVYGVMLLQADELEGYRLAFLMLGVFAIATLVILFAAKRRFPHPETMEETKPKTTATLGGSRFVLYLIAIALIAFGFLDYPFLAFHASNRGLIDVSLIPLLYAMAMGVDALSALFFGHLYDKIGVGSLIGAIAVSAFVAPLVFLFDNTTTLLIGIAFWGIGMGAQESILKAVVASLVDKPSRATAYGIFYAVFGGFWFLGSTIVGILYGYSFWLVALFAFVAQVLGIVVLAAFVFRERRASRAAKGGTS